MARTIVVVMLALCVLRSVAEAADVPLAYGTRIRVMTGAPPWTEEQGVRQLPGRRLREDENSLTFQPTGGEEIVTWTKKGRWLTGELVGVDDHYLMMRLSKTGQTLKLPAGRVSRLEVSKGSGRGKGALRGAGIGALSLALLATTGSCSGGRSSCLLDGGAYAALGAVSGSVYGALIGLAIGRERWRPANVPSAQVSVMPLPRGGAGVKLALQW
jgi:hypothetical protein